MSDSKLEPKPGHPHTHIQHEHGQDRKGSRIRGIHRSWIFWVAIVLMLAGIGYFVTSVDFSLRGSHTPARQPAP